MDRRAWIIVGTIAVIFAGLLWLTWGAQISTTPKDPSEKSAAQEPKE